MNDTDELLALEAARCAAIEAGDKAALRALLTEDYVHVYGGGLSSDRDAWVAHVTEVPRAPIREDVQVRVYGDAAVLTGRMINRIRPKADAKPADEIGGKVPVREDVITFATQVAIRQDGRWRFCSFQLTRVVD